MYIVKTSSPPDDSMSVPQADPLQEAVRLRATGDRAAALAAIDRILSSLDDGDVGKHLRLAGELAELGELDRAETLVRRVLARQPEHPWARNSLALVYRRRGMYERAAELFLELADRHRDIPVFRLQACVDLQTLRRFEEALPHLDAFLRHEPRHVDARLRRALALAETRRHEQAIAQYRELLDEDGANVAVLMGLSRSLEALGRIDECLEPARRVRTIQPDHMGAVFLLARVLERSDDIGAALALWHDVLARDPGAVAPQMRYAETLFRAGSFLEAQAQWRACRERFPGNVDVLIGAALFARRVGRRVEAAALLREARSVEPDRLRLSYEYARELAHLGRVDEAAAYLAQEPSRDDDVEAFRSTLSQAGRGAPAREHSEERVDTQPARWLDEAEACVERGDFESCGRLLELACDRALKTEQPESQAQLDRLLWNMHRFGRADLHAALVSHFQVVTPRFINHGGVVLQFAESGRIDRAQKLVAAACPRLGDEAATRLRVKLAKAEHDTAAADVLGAQGIRPRSVVSLADLKDWLRILIGAERIGEARDLLARHEAAFASTDLLDERIEILRFDLRLADELETLQREVRHDPHHETAALRLTRALGLQGRTSEARALMARWEGRRKRRVDWLRVGIDVTFHGTHDWDEVFAAHDAARGAADAIERMVLWPFEIEHLMLRGRHDHVDEQIDAFLAVLRVQPMHAVAKGWTLLGSASRLLRLRRHREAAAILDDLQQRALPPLHDALHRTCAANAAYQQQVRPFERHMGVLRRERDRVVPVTFGTASSNDGARLRAAVLVHLFYPELWPELARHLRSLDGTDFELFVSVAARHAGSGIEATIRDGFPGADVGYVENRGFDVGAHWQTLRRCDLSRFDVVLLLQSKMSSHVRVGDAWRQNLLGSLIGTPDIWRDNLRMLSSDPHVGMIASAFHRNTRDVLICDEMRRTLEAVGMPTGFDQLKDHYEFVGGTMMILRAHLLADIYERTVSRIAFEPYETLTLARRRDATFAHAVERVLGMYVGWRGYRTIWRA